MSASFPPSSVQKAFINDSFNSTMFNNLLTGIYTVLYFANKKGSKNWFVIGTISISFLAYVVLGGLQWFLNKAALIDDGSSLEATFLAFFSPQFAWVIYATDICSFLIDALADGLMICGALTYGTAHFTPSHYLRFCYSVRLVRSITFHIGNLSVSLTTSTGLDLSVVVMAAVEDFNPSSSQGDILNKLLGSSLFVTFATTLVSTTLIAYRIHSVSKENVIQGTRRRVNHVIEILVQSAAVYSLASFAIAL
ncbi:hypothetical protein CPB84DRAFT_1855922 [Gymnopilus junonius]|uniref:Uncharacterized protein n=1 Tax=Gymnopilus junonius TaxID=109634 RepID=A0A9P5TF92_GYMJU|nr:hypothetical protein CPB84DRAFT_1855922 [Gymnopilus junonius]